MKNDIKKALYTAGGLLLLLTACVKKQEKPNQSFYGKLMITAARIPDTTGLEVRYQGQVLGNIPLNPGVRLEAGLSGKLAVYLKGINQKIADTTITIKKNEISSYRVVYIPDLGLSGWLNTKPVQPDSIALLIFNKMEDFYTAHPSVDLYIFYMDYATLVRKETGIVIHNFEKTKLTQAIILPYWYDKPNLQTQAYYGKFKDNATGEFIKFPPRNRDFFALQTSVERGTMLVPLTSSAGAINSDGYIQL
ncbi:hypothetical protein [Mucilaginibacter paludis]|uniref:Lipoprotein n=1 Tax=Mucilaginibacter paludis DSM 18603 TaxID=714943 RepID=H1Y946_9SPHI|nr:hypothetical protein [Mucilaginibacter paludis]EHQ29084.1 hypothetical protein Mucpa_5005 [Mucilaginibacter paludis DSM 18603]